jgi:hypothetical protein
VLAPKVICISSGDAYILITKPYFFVFVVCFAGKED